MKFTEMLNFKKISSWVLDLGHKERERERERERDREREREREEELIAASLNILL
jgi:hypothetical protein